MFSRVGSYVDTVASISDGRLSLRLCDFLGGLCSFVLHESSYLISLFATVYVGNKNHFWQQRAGSLQALNCSEGYICPTLYGPALMHSSICGAYHRITYFR